MTNAQREACYWHGQQWLSCRETDFVLRSTPGCGAPEPGQENDLLLVLKWPKSGSKVCWKLCRFWRCQNCENWRCGFWDISIFGRLCQKKIVVSKAEDDLPKSCSIYPWDQMDYTHAMHGKNQIDYRFGMIYCRSNCGRLSLMTLHVQLWQVFHAQPSYFYSSTPSF